MNRRGFIIGLGLAPLAALSAVAMKTAEPSPTVGVDLGTGDEMTSIALFRPISIPAIDLEFISSRSFAFHEAEWPSPIDLGQAVRIRQRRFQGDESTELSLRRLRAVYPDQAAGTR